MEKSNHNYPNFNIPYEELMNFIEPINVSIEIPCYEIENITIDKETAKKIENQIYQIIEHLLSYCPTLQNYINNNAWVKNALLPLVYTPHLTGYDFRFSPIFTTNMIFCILGHDHRVPFINLDNKAGMEYFKEYAISYCNEIIRQEINLQKRIMIYELKNNIDRVCELYNIPMDIKNYLIPKDALFYLAYKSLKRFETTKEIEYLIFAKEYYENVSHMNTSQYPHSIVMSGERLWYPEFRNEYQNNVPNELVINPNNYLLSGEDVLLAWDILRPGEADEKIRQIVEKARNNPNVDYEKYKKLFEEKMNFYLRSPYVKNIKGKYGLSGYMGFLYNNEYLLFDKFYNSDTINPFRRTILTHGEAIYALPSDRFSILNNTKQNIIKEKQRDVRIKKLNHTNTFVRRANEIIYGPNLSTSTLDIELAKQKKKILIRDK